MRALLGRFFSGPLGEFYVRELGRVTGLPITTIQRQLRALELHGVLKSRLQGPLKFYSLDQTYRYMPEFRSVVLREMRRGELEKNLKKILGILKKKYHPDKVILFGSLVGGRVSPDSDLDILIVKKGVPNRYWDRVKQVAPLLAGCTVGVDYLVWTPDEFEMGRRTNLFLKDEVIGRGKVVYERAA